MLPPLGTLHFFYERVDPGRLVSNGDVLNRKVDSDW